MRRLSSWLMSLAGTLVVLPAAADEWGTLHGRFLHVGKPPRPGGPGRCLSVQFLAVKRLPKPG